MRVCFIWRDVTAIGGVSSWILQCLRKLAEHGVEARALSFVRHPSHQLDVSDVESQIVFIPPQGKWESLALFRRRLARVIRDIAPDLLIINEQIYAEDTLHASAGCITVVNVVHSDRDEAYPIFEELVGLNVPQWCVSQVIVQKLQERLAPDQREMVRHTLLGVERPAEKRATHRDGKGALRLAYVGRLSHYQKQIEDLPPFVKALKELGVSFTLDIAGDGPEQEWLAKALSDQGLDNEAVLHGPVKHDEALKILRDADIFLLFSNFEGLPLTLLEAMVRGAVPVVTDLPSGISEVIRDGENGRVFPVGDPNCAAEIVKEVASGPGELSRLRAAALKTVEAYLFDEKLKDFVELFHEVVNAPKPRTPKSKIGWRYKWLPPALIR